MQSAVSLVNSLTSDVHPEGTTPTIDELSTAFLQYGTARPKEEAVQQQSAAMCRYENARKRG